MAKQGKAGTQSGKKITANERKYLKVKAQLEDAIKIGKELIIAHDIGGSTIVKRNPRYSEAKRVELEKKKHEAESVAQGVSEGKAQNKNRGGFRKIVEIFAKNKRGGGKVKKYAHGGKVRSYNFIN